MSRVRRRIVAVMAVPLVMAACAGAVAAVLVRPAHPAPVTPRPQLIAADLGGRALGAHPQLDGGAEIRLTAQGFTPQADVDVRLVGNTTVTTRADARGIVQLAYTMPQDVPFGENRLAIIGPPAEVTDSATGTVVTMVPKLAVLPFHSGPTELANTGIPMPTMLLLGACVLLAGTMVLSLAGRRCRPTAESWSNTGRHQPPTARGRT